MGHWCERNRLLLGLELELDFEFNLHLFDFKSQYQGLMVYCEEVIFVVLTKDYFFKNIEFVETHRKSNPG